MVPAHWITLRDAASRLLRVRPSFKQALRPRRSIPANSIAVDARILLRRRNGHPPVELRERGSMIEHLCIEHPTTLSLAIDGVA
jgi:hypothetical protein